MQTKIAEVFIQCNGAFAGTSEAPSWHIKVLDCAETMEEARELGSLARERVLNMKQAEAEGLALPTAITEAAAAVFKDAEDTRVRHDELVAEMEKRGRDAQADKEAALTALKGVADAEVARIVAECNAKVAQAEGETLALLVRAQDAANVAGAEIVRLTKLVAAATGEEPAKVVDTAKEAR